MVQLVVTSSRHRVKTSPPVQVSECQAVVWRWCVVSTLFTDGAYTYNVRNITRMVRMMYLVLLNTELYFEPDLDEWSRCNCLNSVAVRSSLALTMFALT